MSEPWRIEQRRRADAALSQLLAAYPALSLDDGEAEWLVGTHLVAFGAFEGRPAVVKYYDWKQRKDQEEKALRLFAPTGLVPRLYSVQSESVLVMQRLPGRPFDHVEADLECGARRRLYRQLGLALARIAEVAPGRASGGRRDLEAGRGCDYGFYCQAALDVLFDTVTGRAAKVLAREEVPHEALLTDALRALRGARDAILAYPTFIQMDDVHTHNVIVDAPEVTGFIDLEMTRYGNEVLLLAAALPMALGGWSEGWTWLRRGYEEGRGPMGGDLLALVRVAAPFSQWCRFMWYWTGDPGDFEEGARAWPVRDIKAIVEGVRALPL